MSRTSRSSRHQKLGNLTESGLGLGAPGGIGGSSTEVHVGSVHESREERLKKREEDKELKKQAIELRAFNLAKRREREDATAANGGIVPEGMENEQEKEVRRAREEKERTKEAKEEVKRLKAVEKARLAAEKKAIKTGNQSYLPDEIYVPVEEEEPWYLDCEICKKEGWNLVRRRLASLSILMLTLMTFLLLRMTVLRSSLVITATTGNISTVTLCLQRLLPPTEKKFEYRSITPTSTSFAPSVVSIRLVFLMSVKRRHLVSPRLTCRILKK